MCCTIQRALLSGGYSINEPGCEMNGTQSMVDLIWLHYFRKGGRILVTNDHYIAFLSALPPILYTVIKLCAT